MNGFKTVMLMMLLTLLLVWGGAALGGRQGMTFALIFAFAINSSISSLVKTRNAPSSNPKV